MNFNEYQKRASKTDYRSKKFEKKLMGNLLFYPTLGLVGEAGEVAEKVKKLFRDHEGKVDAQFKENIKLELGDILWYVAKLARALGIPLEAVAQGNLKKIMSRKKRNMIHGNGDHR